MNIQRFRHLKLIYNWERYYQDIWIYVGSFFFFFFFHDGLSLFALVGWDWKFITHHRYHPQKKKKISTHRHQIKNLTSHTQILSLNVIPPLLPSPLYFHTNSIYPFIMRPLTEEETKVVFEKLANYIGRNISFLIDNPENPHVFRLQKIEFIMFRNQLLNLLLVYHVNN